MGECLTERVRDQMLAKILSFEVGWFDEDDNSSAAVCARLASQATKVRSLVGDRMCLLVQAAATATLGFALAFSLSWRLSLVQDRTWSFRVAFQASNPVDPISFPIPIWIDRSRIVERGIDPEPGYYG